MQQFLRTHHPRDVVLAIEAQVHRLMRMALYTSEPLDRGSYTDVYQRAILKTIEEIDPAIAALNKEFDSAMDAGDRKRARKVGGQLAKGLWAYTTKLRR